MPKAVAWHMLPNFERLHSHSIPEVLMRHLRQNVLLFVALATIACRESTTPSSVPVQYSLNNVNGERLPFVLLSPIPEQDVTLVSSTLFFFGDGNGVFVDRIRDQSTVETDRRTTFKYQLSDGTIRINSCSGDASCDFQGVVSGLTLNLNRGIRLQDNTPLLYSYHRWLPD
jgi:hypothetical protein